MNKKAINIICLMLFIVGIFAWSRGLVGAPGASNLSEYTPWGLYIALFVFFEALCVGTLFIAAVGSSSLPRLKMAIIGTVGAVCAGMAILPDLGSPLAAWHMLFTPNITAPMLLDFWLLGLILVFGILLILGLNGDRKGLTRLSQIVLPILTVLLPIATALLFTTLPGRIGWSSLLEIGVFITQAALAGLCVLMILQGLAKNHTKNVSKFVLAFLLINLALLIGEAGHAVYSSGIETLPFKAMLSGELAWLFWSYVIVGLVIPVVILAKDKFPLAGGILALVGIAMSKYLFVLKGNIYPFLNLGEGLVVPELGMASNGFSVANYFPSGLEWLVGLGIFALGVLLVNLTLNLLARKENGKTNVS